MMMQEKSNPLNQSIQYLKSIGPKRAESFRKIGIETIRDLLFYFPSRHLDRTTTLSAAKAYGYLMNRYDGELTIIGKVDDIEKRYFNRKEILKIQFRDSTGFFECVWFQGAKYFFNIFNVGDIFAVSGKASLSKYGNLQFTHPDFDKSTEKLFLASKRFKFEEAFYLEVLVALRKQNYKRKLEGYSFGIKTNLVANFLKTLPFNLTNAQLKVLSEIKRDLLQPSPMNRLLQGDVGSGKTIVALIAMLIAVDSGYQSALMVPTEILADQHAKNISKMMRKLFEIHKAR